MVIDEIIEEPKISTSKVKHIKDVVKILEKQPALKNDIRRNIVEELTKGYINPDQFKEYNQAIEEAGIKEAPQQSEHGKHQNHELRSHNNRIKLQHPWKLNKPLNYQRVRKLKILKIKTVTL